MHAVHMFDYEYVIISIQLLFLEGNTASTFEKILIFSTGSSGVPPVGFCPEPSLDFLHVNYQPGAVQARFPTANTCVNCICLPTMHETYSAFKENMDFALCNTHGFGQE